MLQRCTNPKKREWPRYGGRGITVCERWLVFENFLADMGERPAGMTLDRVNNDGPYSPDNCEWRSQLEQARNMSRNRILTHQGRSMCLAQWAEELGIAQGTLSARLGYGWSVDRALAEPVDHRKARQS